MFQLSAEEAAPLRSQIVTLKVGRGLHRKYLPYVFTEQGAAMLSSAPVLHRVLRNILESRTLAALRDTLLPKLISGEIRVKDAERFVSRRSNA